jgi:hypothetical protein
MCRCFTRVKRNNVVVGVDVFVASIFSCTSLCRDVVGSKWPGPNLHDHVHETGSALDMWHAPHMPLVGVCFFHYSCHLIYNNTLVTLI